MNAPYKNLNAPAVPRLLAIGLAYRRAICSSRSPRAGGPAGPHHLREAQAFHAGEVNARSVGVEICNPELVERNDPQSPRPVVALEVTNAGSVGARRLVLGFYKEQVTATIALAKAVSGIFGFPSRLPRATSPTSTAGVTRGVDPRMVSNQYAGTCGHYHVKDSKVDPGVSLWPALREAGFTVG